MRRTLLVLTLGLSLCPLAATYGQGTAPGALSDALRTHLQNERLAIVTSLRGLPLGVRDGLQTLFESSSLDIAEPGGPFQATGAAVAANVSIRRLVAAGCSMDHCLVYYERGGGVHTWQVAFFHWTPAATRFEWGGSAPGGLATIDDVRNAVLAGRITGTVTSW